MIFSHGITSNEFFTIDAKVNAVSSAVLLKPIFMELWRGYTFQVSDISFIETGNLIFKIGNADEPYRGEEDYAISVTKEGICITAGSEKNLIYGYMTFLDLIKMDEKGKVIVPLCEIKEHALVKMRAIHYCVFHDTELWELERFIRLCGVLKYTHIVLEFWGMLKFDCLKELAWDNAYSKTEVRPLIELANDMGIEIIPMFNHWGHAAGCRVLHGKHVVLNQNPSLWYYFNDTGWNWNIRSKRTKKLLQSIRIELMELCGSGEYFHLGCDEAYDFEHTKENMDEVCEYLNEISSELAAYNRRVIMWGDMLLFNDKEYIHNDNYIAFCPDRESQQYMFNNLNKNIVIADWQYEIRKFPVETAITLKDNGYDVVVSPWDEDLKCIAATMETIIEYNLFGVLHTTWNTLSKGTPYITEVAQKCWSRNEPMSKLQELRVHTAATLRKCFVTSEYQKTGWARVEISTITD